MLISQIKKRETEQICSYAYSVDNGYEIKVTKLGIDAHVKAVPPVSISYCAPTVLFISKESGSIDFPSRSMSVNNGAEFVLMASKAAELYDFISEHYGELVNGVDFLNQNEKEENEFSL